MKLVLVTILALLATSLAGCAGDDGPAEIIQDVPDEISSRDLQELEDRALAEFPNVFTFPGQEILDPVVTAFEGVMGPGSGAVAPEFPHDDGIIEAGGIIETHSLEDLVEVGQAVEIRMKLKWQGSAGSSGDYDIYVNVPGIHDSYQPTRYDESFNWNVVTKSRIINAVRVDGEPFEVGVQFSSGKVLTSPLAYTLNVELFYGHNVLAPGIPYAMTMPEGGAGFIFESEPLGGDEHITSSFILVDPQDNLVKYLLHNDIGTETLFVSAPVPGEYIVYAQSMEGGFLRVETDIPNPDHEVRALERTVVESVVHSSAPAPGTYEEQCLPPLTYLTGLGTDDPTCLENPDEFGASGSFEAGETFPLEIYATLDTTGGGAIDAAMKIFNSEGVQLAATWAFVNSESDGTRLGWHQQSMQDHSGLNGEAYTWGVVNNIGAVDLGYGIISYVR